MNLKKKTNEQTNELTTKTNIFILKVNSVFDFDTRLIKIKMSIKTFLYTHRIFFLIFPFFFDRFNYHDQI